MKKLVIDEYREKCDLQKRRLFSIFVRFKVRSVALAEVHSRVTGLGLKVLTNILIGLIPSVCNMLVLLPERPWCKELL